MSNLQTLEHIDGVLSTNIYTGNQELRIYN